MWQAEIEWRLGETTCWVPQIISHSNQQQAAQRLEGVDEVHDQERTCRLQMSLITPADLGAPSL